MFVCLSPGGQSLTVGESAKDKLLVGTVNGVFSFVKNNGGWNQQETMLPDQHISAIIFEPSTQTLFAGSYNGKIFASGDSGKSWEQRDQGIGGKEIYSLASQLVGGKPSLCRDRNRPTCFTATTWERAGRSFPACVRCPASRSGLSLARPIRRMRRALPFTRMTRTLFTSPSKSVVFSEARTAGKTWTTIDSINPDAHRVLIPTNDPSKLYGTAPTTNCGPETPAGFCVSTDGGTSWKSMTPRDFRIGYVDPFFVHPKIQLLFVAGAKTGPGTWRNLHTADARIARSRDGGKTWDMLTGGLPDHIRANIEGMAMDTWNGGYAIFAGTTDGDVFYSDDEGERLADDYQRNRAVSKSHHHVNLSLDEQAAHH